MVTTYDPTTNTVLTSATVNVYNPGTVTPISATIFDRLGNTLSNPLTSDASTGLLDFYVNVAQEVDLVVSKGGFTTRTYSNVPVIDDSSLELTALLTTTGDMVYASGNNTPVRLPIGTAGNVMASVGGVPAWSSAVNVASGNVSITGSSITLTGNGSVSGAWSVGSGATITGNAAIGASTISSVGLKLQSNVTGATTEAGIISQPTGDTSGTTELSAFYGNPTSAASSYTVTSAACFHATPVAKGSGSTITSAYGLLVDSQTAGGTNNYGVYVNTPSGGGSVNCGVYVAGGGLGLVGTAPNIGSGIGYGGGAGQGTGSTATNPAIKGGGSFGPLSAGGVGWIGVNINGTACFIPYWT